MKLSHTTAIAFVSMLALACSSSPSSQMEAISPAAYDLVFEDGAVIAGYYEAESVFIPAGATVVADGDLTIMSTGDVVIEGTLLAAGPTDESEGIDAPRIEIRTSRRLFVGGAVTGGNGLSFADANGQNFGRVGGAGSSVLLSCSTYTLLGTVRAGHGGSGGAGASGGRGGDLHFVGRPDLQQVGFDDASGAETGFFGGVGGAGGRGYRSAGGAGGASGAIMLDAPKD
jgi:hypothetical protein